MWDLRKRLDLCETSRDHVKDLLQKKISESGPKTWGEVVANEISKTGVSDRVAWVTQTMTGVTAKVATWTIKQRKLKSTEEKQV